jgi:hypothetical protein
MGFLASIRLLVLSIWLGGSVFFVAAAQAAFSVLPDRELAGSVVGRNLSIMNYAGIAIAVILLLTSMLGASTVRSIWLWVERALLVLLALACAAGQFVIGYWISSVRSQISGPVAELAADDPLRSQFNMLHQYSEWVFMAAMIAALAAFLLIANRRPKVVKTSTPDPFDFSKEFKV